MRGHHMERCTLCSVPWGICIYSVTHKTTPYALGDEARSYLFHQTPRWVGLSRVGIWLRAPCTQMGLLSKARHQTGLAVTGFGHLSSSAVTSLSKTVDLGEGQICRWRSRGFPCAGCRRQANLKGLCSGSFARPYSSITTRERSTPLIQTEQ